MVVRKLALGSVTLAALALLATHCGDGKTSLVRVVNEAQGENCPAGGFRVLAGADDNGNGTLDDDEVEKTSFACNGEAGQKGDTGLPCDLRPRGACPNADLRRVTFMSAQQGGDPFGYDLAGINLSGADLRGAVFFATQLDDAVLAGARLDDAIFSNSSLTRADFTGASVKRVRFTGTNIAAANLTSADFTEALIPNIFFATARGAKFVGATLGNIHGGDFTGADFSDLGQLGDVTGAGLVNAKFNRANLLNVTFGTAADASTVTGAVFDFANLIGVDFGDAAIAGAASFTNAYITSGTVAPGVDLVARGALNLSTTTNLADKDLRYAVGFNDFTGYDLSRADLSGRNGAHTFTDANLTGAKLIGADLSSSVFTGANCEGADFTDARVRIITVSGTTNFTNAIFTRALLQGTNFQTATITGAQFGHATLFGTILASAQGAATFSGAYTRPAPSLPAGATGTITIAPTAVLDNADLSGIFLDGNSFTAGASLVNVNFTGARIFEANFSGIPMRGANFTDAVATYVSFGGADLTGANFTRADLTSSVFDDTNLSNANLTGASLSCASTGVDVSDLAAPNTTGVTWSATECPDGTVSSDNSPATCDGHDIPVLGSVWVSFVCGAI